MRPLSNSQVKTTKVVKYLVRHPKQSKTIVFLHGFGGNLSIWNDIIDQLPGYQCISLDLRGHGHSGRAKSTDFYQISNFIADIKSVVSQVKIDKCVLVGHCFGGMLALEFTKKYPQNVSQLILFNAADSLPKIVYKRAVHKLLRWYIKHIAKIIPDLGFNSYPDFKKYINTSDFDFKRIAEDITHTHLHAYLTILAQTISHDFHIDQNMPFPPTTVVQGSKDRVIRRNLTTGLYHKLSHAKLITIDTGHIAPITHPKKVAAIIQNALTGKYSYRSKSLS